MALFAHLLNYSSYDIIRGANIEAEFDNYDSIINTLIQYGGAPVANITALRALVTAAYYVGASPDKPITDGQIKVVQAVSDGTNTTIGIYEFKAGDATSDTDGGSNVDTDGIVAPTQSGMGRWFRVATTNMITNRGVVALRTMFNALNIDLNTDSVAADAFLVLTKRAAASQVKILTNEQVAIRNLADSAYEDFAALAGTFAGAVSGTTGTFSGAVSGTTGTFSGAVSGTTGTFSSAVSGTTGSFTGAVSIGGTLDCNSNLISRVANAVSGTDAPNLAQVQSLITASSEPLYGDYSDGNVTVAGTTTLTSDMFYDTLTVTGTLNTAGYAVFAKTLAGNGTIQNNGVAGSVGANATNGAPGAGGSGAAGTNTGSLGGSVAGAAGGNGSAASNGTAGTAGTAAAITISGGAGAAGGAGGPGNIPSTGGAGGAAGASSATSTKRLRDLGSARSFYDYVNGGLIKPRGGSAGGGGGGASGGGQCGAGGGGGGSSGGPMLICAKTITFTGLFSSVGGAGGRGGNSYADGTGSGGGGGGGSGGIIIIASNTNGLGYTTAVTAGAGGAAGTPITGGYTGVAGSSGAAGSVITITP